jgi:hypothetical protein
VRKSESVLAPGLALLTRGFKNNLECSKSFAMDHAKGKIRTRRFPNRVHIGKECTRIESGLTEIVSFFEKCNFNIVPLFPWFMSATHLHNLRVDLQAHL